MVVMVVVRRAQAVRDEKREGDPSRWQSALVAEREPANCRVRNALGISCRFVLDKERLFGAGALAGAAGGGR